MRKHRSHNQFISLPQEADEVFAAFLRPAADTSDLRSLASIIEAILREQGLKVLDCKSDGDCTIRIDMLDHTLILRRPDAEHIEFHLRPHYTDIDGEAASTLKSLMRQTLTLVDPEEIAWLSRESTVAADTFRSVVPAGGPRRVTTSSARKPKLPKSWKAATKVARQRQADAPAQTKLATVSKDDSSEQGTLRDVFRPETNPKPDHAA